MNLFAHRGYLDNKYQENSLESLKAAKNYNFNGIEIDLWFCDDDFIISHDDPKKIKSFKEVFLKDFLIYKENFLYWLDFKNLTAENIEKATLRLSEIIQSSEVPFINFYFVPYITNLDLSKIILQEFRKEFNDNVGYVALCDNLTCKTDEAKLINFIVKNNIKFLSIHYKLIDENIVQNLPEVQIFAWTVNEISDLKRLRNLGVNNFATDLITLAKI
jgi:glycerophosphoryl diester phosphodiesterase